MSGTGITLQGNLNPTCEGMDQHLEETQKLKAGITEQTRSMEVLDRNMQNVSREITAMVGKIEEDW